MAPRAKLNPIDPSLVPFGVGEKVAFLEDHIEPAVSGMYGIIEEIGVDTEGKFRFDVAVIDPFTGELKDGTKTIYRAGMEDIQ